jgi:hypothetical protein
MQSQHCRAGSNTDDYAAASSNLQQTVWRLKETSCIIQPVSVTLKEKSHEHFLGYRENLKYRYFLPFRDYENRDDNGRCK